MPLTTARSSTTCPTGVYCALCRVSCTTRCAEARVKASRKAVPGGTKAVPGRCRPMISISIWLLLAVP